MKNTENTVELKDFEMTDLGNNTTRLVANKGMFHIAITTMQNLNRTTASVSVNDNDACYSIESFNNDDINTIELDSNRTEVTSINLKTTERAINFINKITLPEYL